MAEPVLYVVATPIGNLEDLSPRARRVLGECTLILAEDTRTTRKLLTRFEIKADLRPCHQHNERSAADKLRQWAAEHPQIALVSDAGTPNVSDPGATLLEAAWEIGMQVLPLPGPSAVTAALSVLPLRGTAFTFHGFLPKKRGEREAVYQRMSSTDHAHVVFLPPHGADKILHELAEWFPGATASLHREMTKVHEEHLRFVLPELPEVTLKGEMTLVLVPLPPETEATVLELGHLSTRDHLLTLMTFRGRTKREAIAEVSRQRNLPRNEVYRIALSLPE